MLDEGVGHSDISLLVVKDTLLVELLIGKYVTVTFVVLLVFQAELHFVCPCDAYDTVLADRVLGLEGNCVDCINSVQRRSLLNLKVGYLCYFVGLNPE